jgi:spermidine/putrescine transport system permease protein
MMSDKKQPGAELLLTLPSFMWLVVFFLLPSVLIFAYAFKPRDLYGGIGPGWSLESIKALLNWNVLQLIWRTLWLSCAATLLTIVLALPMGYHMATLPKGRRNLLLILVVIPFWSSLLIRIFAWKIVLHPEGLLHRLLEGIGIIHADTMLLYNPMAVLFVMIYTFLPFAILPIYAAAAKFNFSLIEAAIDLGASRWQAFTKIFIPGVHKGIATAFFMVFIPAIGTYVIPDLVGGATSDMICNRIAQKTLAERNLPEASALAALLMLSLLIPMIVIERYNSSKKKLEGARNRE